MSYIVKVFFLKHCTKTHWVVNFKTSSNKSNSLGIFPSACLPSESGHTSDICRKRMQCQLLHIPAGFDLGTEYS